MATWDDGPDCKVWTPSLLPANGDVPVIDGSEHFVIANLDEAPDWTYETRDARRVMRMHTLTPGGSGYDALMAVGPEFDRQTFVDFGWEWKVTFYSNLSYFAWRVWGGFGGFQSIYPKIDNRGGTVSLSLSGSFIDENGFVHSDSGVVLPDTSGWGADDWYTIGIRIAADRTPYAMLKRESDPDNWLLLHPTLKWLEATSATPPPRLLLLREAVEDPASVVDLWKWEWRTV